MNRLTRAAVGAVSAVMATGCTVPHMEAVPVESHVTYDNPTVNGIDPLLLNQKQSVLELFAADAPIHVIFIPVEQDFTEEKVPRGEENDVEPIPILEEIRQSYEDKLRIGDKRYLEEVLGQVVAATSGRYTPLTITFEQSDEKIFLEQNCLDDTDLAQAFRIRDFAGQYAAEDAMNVAVIGADACEDATAYNSVGSIPVLSISKPIVLGKHIMHEEGHGAAVYHAGVLDCEDKIEATKCKKFDVLDEASLMSYVGHRIQYDFVRKTASVNEQERAVRFSTPELFELGLLEDGEALIDPADGVYKLSPSSLLNGDIKLIRFNHLTTSINVSFEHDPTASFDIDCIETDAGAVSEEGFLYGTQDESSKAYFDCYKVRERETNMSVQVRIGSKQGKYKFQTGFDVVTRPSRNHKEAITRPFTFGEVVAGVLYEDKHVTVNFDGWDTDGSALISVLNK